MKKCKVYIAGPMTGIPQFNFPAFEAAAVMLRTQGWEVISPHECDSPEVQAAAWASTDGKLDNDKVAGESWGSILARDVSIVADQVEGIAYLPGWTRSRGAKLETLTGLLTGKRFFKLVLPDSGLAGDTYGAISEILVTDVRDSLRAVL